MKKPDFDAEPFLKGEDRHAYEWLGCHAKKTDGGYIYTFRVWAPKASAVFLTGDFNGWSDSCRMKNNRASGVWYTELSSERSLDGCRYKYGIVSRKGTVLKADPYAFYGETLSRTASVVHSVKAEWSDEKWLEDRKKPFEDREHFYPAPMNIYEMHLGSWHTRDGKPNADGEHYLNYREIADMLVPYLTEMGYTHVELMPVAEHPYDGSWGYQVCGYYAPTSRFGTPEDLIYFVNTLHCAGIGVILDWVPAHFPKDEHGLIEFDGGALYEYKDKYRMEHSLWGTRYFDVGRGGVISFLISNALFWLREYHIDGLRADAVASMLYLDFDKKPGEWRPGKNGDNKNTDAADFFRRLNTAVKKEFPDVLMIAEESSAWPKVTAPASDGGLGFDMKWNMGWANDIFDYVSTDPYFRSGKHGCLTFPMMYAYSEHFILPVSHDEVTHGKRSLLGKCFGEYDDKFACMRALITYMMTMPGKKLLFMGCENAPFREWDHSDTIEWFMLDFPRHAQMREFIKTINHIYLFDREFWDIDDGWDGFEWIDPDDAWNNTVSYVRRSRTGDESLVVINFSPCAHPGYKLRVKCKGEYEERLCACEERFGGGGQKCGTLKAVPRRDGKQTVYELTVDIAPYGAAIFKKTRKSSKEEKGNHV